MEECLEKTCRIMYLLNYYFTLSCQINKSDKDLHNVITLYERLILLIKHGEVQHSLALLMLPQQLLLPNLKEYLKYCDNDSMIQMQKDYKEIESLLHNIFDNLFNIVRYGITKTTSSSSI